MTSTMGHQHTFRDRTAEGRMIIAVDGEGQNVPYSPGVVHPNPVMHDRGWHTYTMLCAADDRGFARTLRHDGTRREADPLRTLMPDEVMFGATPDMDCRARNYGLRTVDCLEFLLDLPADADVVSYYFSYDVDKIVADLPLRNLRELHSSEVPADRGERVYDLARRFGLKPGVVAGARLIDKESTVWGNYHIAYMPRKKLTITDLSAGRIQRPGETRQEWARRVIVWDVFGFFQSSFVKALKGAKYLFDPDVVERIAVMKEKRAEFENLPDDDIERYCHQECEYLSRLMRDLFRHFERLDLKLKGFHGSGALAEAWLTREHIRSYIAVPNAPTCCDSDPAPINLPEHVMLSAYFGGRFEVADIGGFGRLWSYDIRSAYPAMIATLPCLAHATFRRVDRYVPGRWGVYLVGSETSGRFAPFPFRVADPQDDQAALTQPSIYGDANRLERARSQLAGSVYYAHGGRRWVWQDEVAAARGHFGDDAIPVYDGWVLERGCDHQPFADIPDIYERRNIMKGDGPGTPSYDGAEKVLKLLMNSIYGKPAQSVGVTERKGVPHPPPFQCFIWAGMITSGTRAKILDAIMQANTVSIATDGILTTEPLDHVLPISKRLGDWEAETATDAHMFQSGVYTFLKPGCDQCGGAGCNKCRVFKTRGFSKDEMPAEKLIAAWKADDWEVPPEPEATRFVRGKAGMQRSDPLNYLGQWVPSRHSVRITHTRRRGDMADDELGLPEPAVIDGVYSSTPYVLGPDDLSAAYVPKETWSDVDDSRGQEEQGDFLEATAEDLNE